MCVKEIESVIEKLPPDEWDELVEWMRVPGKSSGQGNGELNALYNDALTF